MQVSPFDDNTAWSTDAEGRPLLDLGTEAPGDFSTYTLELESNALDPFFRRVQFSFKALCDSDLDCRPVKQQCPPAESDRPPIDYLAKDFLSFRKALSDFSALRYPEWRERSEADFGVMFMEALCSLADDLSYLQDRIAGEATLETASQRRSIVRHARLVDYEPRPATSSRVLLQLDVLVKSIPAGLVFSARGPDGTTIDFETGTGLVDPNTGKLNLATYLVDPLWNRGITPYFFDDSQQCLKAGSTDMWVLKQGFNFKAGQALLIDSDGQSTADPHIREIVHVTSAVEEFDPLFPGAPAPPTPVTHVFWDSSEALKHDHDLTFDQGLKRTRTILAGNLVPATQGRTQAETFAIDQPPPAAPDLPLAISRIGPNNTVTAPSIEYQHTLQNAPLVWLGVADAEAPPLPEVLLVEQPQIPGGSPVDWIWRRRLLDAEPFESAFTMDPSKFSPIGFRRDGPTIYEYDGGSGNTLRFGDGIFGGVPGAGAVFQVKYRVGAAAQGNVAADSIVSFDSSVGALVSAVTNPFPAEGGADEESDQRVRRLAPQAFRAKQFRAVRPEDYERAAETLSWVQRAGTSFLWTGSWLTVFTSADPKASDRISIDEQIGLIDLLNRRRMAGYESYVPAPRYASIDLIVSVCAKADAFQSDVEEAIVAALSTRKFLDGKTGFFHFDRFTFGTGLEPSALEAAIQNSHGVAGVVSIRYRRRGFTPDYVEMTETVTVAPDEIIRMDNDPSAPDCGSLKVIVGGGK